MTKAHVLGRPRSARASEKSRVLGHPELWRGLCLPSNVMRFHRRTQTVSEPSTAFLSEGSEVVGTCNFNGSVVVSGRVKGEVHATATITVGRAGRVEARLHAPVVIVEGEVVGTIVATERIELREQARVTGDLETPALIIEEHAVFEGQTKRVRAIRNGVTGDTQPVDDRAHRGLDLISAT